ncbi:MAG: FkbM family methyltransferase [Candidatus Margulisiibacteriota bacterium]|nr:MAG: hypothetical protein A2X43_07175 [Candidatus Margulisbacteria bacterium GWD2_39_127]PZM78732.1 MAG: FkbM family methyltransferase [Candidatus Margulisiibacteriota bacterium]HAR63366.1 FkbM family methyltransferase [Candidatus Margulisiibacteriota bacterium]HCT83737.1 FkbM family methyltransferase [Candidatus Margulisiibacteriota bacterium]HCY36410.1 FkbM family methyltransferase [Candidatus Margulisiibacteriota bacterium]
MDIIDCTDKVNAIAKIHTMMEILYDSLVYRVAWKDVEESAKFKDFYRKFSDVLYGYIGYSQAGQDLFVTTFYSNKKNGYFVEIGASDGITNSNTFILEEKYDWKGICIEPNSEFEKLINNRKCLCVNACLSDRVEEIDFLEDGNPVAKGLSGIVKYLGTYKPEGTNYKLTTTRFLDVLIEHNAPNLIDYLSIDTEGSEYIILKDFPFEIYRFGVITVEHNSEKEKRSDLYNLLTSNNYLRVLESPLDDFYVHMDFCKAKV